MTGDWLAALEAAAPAAMLRGSIWAYPLINAGHILGVALLVGAIVPLDLRLLGLWASVPLPPLWRVLTRAAAVGFGLALICGTLLFITRATAYAQSGLFLTKMAVVAAGLVNVLILRMAAPVDLLATPWTTATLPGRVRISACISLGTWLLALALGRLIGYF